MRRHIRDRVVTPSDDWNAWRDGLRAARIPDLFWSASIAKVADPNVRSWASSILEQPECWLGKGFGFFFNGTLNTGKSSIAAIFAMDALRRAEQVLWVATRDVPSIIFREGGAAGAWSVVKDETRTADLLVLDDLGSERFKLDGPAGGALEETVRIFYERGRSVIVTSNINWERLGERYPEPLVSVLKRMVVSVTMNTPCSGSGPDVPGVGALV